MQIRLEGIGKRFHKELIFRNVDLLFKDTGKYALIGNNGSGKSTLLQLISSIGIPTEGKINYQSDQLTIDNEHIIDYFSFCAPYQELPEELTGKELFDFHFNFRKKALDFDSKSFFNLIQLEKQETKQVKYFSSGMKQRMRLGLCILSTAEAYFLDEPTTNLDKTGIDWYSQLLKTYLFDKLLIVSSNIENEYSICDTIINITDFKPKQ